MWTLWWLLRGRKAAYRSSRSEGCLPLLAFFFLLAAAAQVGMGLVWGVLIVLSVAVIAGQMR